MILEFFRKGFLKFKSFYTYFLFYFVNWAGFWITVAV